MIPSAEMLRRIYRLLARDAQAKLALIVAHCLSIHLSICASVRDSSSHAYVCSIARREPHRLPAFVPGPFAPTGSRRPRRKMTARSYS